MPDNTDQTITISLTTYYRLLNASQTLTRLYAAGVDNWEGYSEAFDDEEDDWEEDE